MKVENKGLGSVHSVINQVYENIKDEKLGIPPLFNWTIQFDNIDITRIDVPKLRATVEYTLFETDPLRK